MAGRRRTPEHRCCFGRCFEKALAAFFQGEDPGAALFKEWEAYQRGAGWSIAKGDNWERVLRQGLQLLERLAQDNRIRIRQPQAKLQKKLLAVTSGRQRVRGLCRCHRVSGWHASVCWNGRPPRLAIRKQPEGLLALDPAADLLLLDQRHLRCGHCGLRQETGLRDSVSEGHDQRRAAAGVWPTGRSHRQSDRSCPVSAPHRGIRFPQNGCVSCAHLGLCLGNQHLVETKLIRQSWSERP